MSDKCPAPIHPQSGCLIRFNIHNRNIIINILIR